MCIARTLFVDRIFRTSCAKIRRLLEREIFKVKSADSSASFSMGGLRCLIFLGPARLTVSV